MMGSWVRAPVRSQEVVHNVNDFFFRPRGEIGRLASLRGWCSQGRVGSNPIVVTNEYSKKKKRQVRLSVFFVFEYSQSGAFRDGRSQSHRIKNKNSLLYFYYLMSDCVNKKSKPIGSFLYKISLPFTIEIFNPAGSEPRNLH